MDALETPGGYVVLTEEPNIFRANWIAGAVQAVGIPTHVEQDDLADEFSVSQAAMGQPRVRVLVPRDRLIEANDVFLDLSQPIPLVEEDDEDDEALDEMEAEQKSRMSGIIIAVVLLLFLGPIAIALFGDAIGALLR